MNTSEGRKARRGSVGIRRVTPCLPIRTSGMRKSLELWRCEVGFFGSPRLLMDQRGTA